jgi:ABC-type transport system involved in multi-copper enzyme maturation permease subunit
VPGRILAIALNTYREAVRARLLLGLLGVALAACVYSLFVATLSNNEARVVADLGAATVSLLSVVVAVVLIATSLHRELEYRTIFPILSRPIERWEYLVGKYLGALLTIAVFVAIDVSVVLATLALETGQPPWKVCAAAGLLLGILGALLVRARYTRVFVFIPWALALAAGMWLVAAPAAEERQLVGAAAVLSLCEVSIVAALATLFASFSSPFLTFVFTAGFFCVGRSADTLAHMPVRIFGPFVTWGRAISRVVPNLHTYVPPRALLLDQVPGQSLSGYMGGSALYAVCYAAGLLALAVLVFRRRDFA